MYVQHSVPLVFYMLFVFHSEHAILRKATPRLFDWQFIQTGNYGEHRKFAYRETHVITKNVEI